MTYMYDIYIYMYIHIYVDIHECIRVTAALRLIGIFNIWNLTLEEVLGSSSDSLGLSVDPLGRSEDVVKYCVNTCFNF